MSLKTIVTARSVIDGEHIFIVHETVQEAFHTAQKLHQLGEHKYRQIHMRSSKPSLRAYRWVNLVRWIGA